MEGLLDPKLSTWRPGEFFKISHDKLHHDIAIISRRGRGRGTGRLWDKCAGRSDSERARQPSVQKDGSGGACLAALGCTQGVCGVSISLEQPRLCEQISLVAFNYCNILNRRDSELARFVLQDSLRVLEGRGWRPGRRSGAGEGPSGLLGVTFPSPKGLLARGRGRGMAVGAWGQIYVWDLFLCWDGSLPGICFPGEALTRAVTM